MAKRVSVATKRLQKKQKKITTATRAMKLYNTKNVFGKSKAELKNLPKYPRSVQKLPLKLKATALALEALPEARMASMMSGQKMTKIIMENFIKTQKDLLAKTTNPQHKANIKLNILTTEKLFKMTWKKTKSKR